MSGLSSDYLNPYLAPPDVPGEAESTSPANARYARIGQVMVAWEKLRVPYNAVLAGVTLLAGAVVMMFFGKLSLSPGELVGGAIAANVCFCAGHAVDGYLSWFGLRSRWITWLLFAVGTLAAAAVTALVVLVSTPLPF